MERKDAYVSRVRQKQWAPGGVGGFGEGLREAGEADNHKGSNEGMHLCAIRGTEYVSVFREPRRIL